MKKALLLFALVMCACSSPRYETFSGYAQGGTYRVKLRVNGLKDSPKVIAGKIDDILEGIDTTISGYNKNSLLSRFNAGKRIIPNETFLELYEISTAMNEFTSGAFDAASGPLFDIWGFGFKADSLPSHERIASAMKASGMGRLKKDIRSALSADGSISAADLLEEGEDGDNPILNFNAIAQGYSSDVIARYLHSIGATDMLVDIGEIYCEGLNASGNGWAIGIDNPVDGNMTPGADMRGVWQSDGGGHGVVTSGNYRKFYVKDGKKYAHIIDPRTGWPVEHNLLSATIVATDAATADAVATACMVLGPVEARKLIESSTGLEGCLICSDTLWTSTGFTLN